jgi:hypothetical protein
MFVNHKHKKVPRHHLWFHVTIFGQQTNLLSQSFFSLCHSHHGKKGKRGFKFTITELEHLLDVIYEIIPIGNPDWEKVWHEHSSAYPTIKRTQELLKCKFQELVCKNITTGDPNGPPYVCKAKQILRKFVVATDGLTGGLDIEAESIASNEDGGGMRLVWMRRRTKMLGRLRRG